jgi:hypothetical protein
MADTATTNGRKLRNDSARSDLPIVTHFECSALAGTLRYEPG